MTLHVALCTDENFVVPTLVAATSILENNRDSNIQIHIISEGISDLSKRKFDELAKAYGQKIDVKVVDKTIFDRMVTRSRYRSSMYLRFLLPDFLATESKVLYLDCDTIVRHSLADLYNTDLTDKSCGVVVDQQCDDTQIINRLRLTEPYFNSGVMLMNLDYWRKNALAAKIIAFIKDNPEKCLYPDQDALNVVLQGSVEYLDYGFNYQEMWATMRSYARIHFSKWKDLDDAGENPTIVHFCVDDKPWYNESKNPFTVEWRHYADMHELIGYRPRNRYKKLYYRIEAEIMRLKRWQKKFINQ